MAEFTVRDSNSKLRITCLRKDGAIFNLVGYTVKMRYRIGATYHDPVNMTVIDALGGVAEYTFGLGTGIVITAGVNDKIDIDLDVTSFPPGMSSITIAAATYPTIKSITEAIDALFKAIEPTSECTVSGGKVRFGNPGYPIKTFFATGPNAATSAAVTLGFLPTDEDLGLDERIAVNNPVVTQPDDLSEEGIMYVEVEITETATGKIVSSSDVQLFVVRGKVAP